MRWKEADILKLKKQGRVKEKKKGGRPKLKVKYYKFVLYYVDFNFNKVLSLAKSSKYSYNAHVKNQYEHIRKQLENMPIIDFPAKYVYNWYCENKKEDPGNISAGRKVVEDCLQHVGIIENDGWNQVTGIEHRFYIDKKDPRLELEIIG